MPERKGGVSDYFYGDSLEVLKLGSATANGIYNYCFNTIAAITDSYCADLGLSNAIFETMQSYGLQGEVYFVDGRNQRTVATVTFCGPMANGTQGATDANRALLKTAQIACPAPGARRGGGEDARLTASSPSGALSAAQGRVLASHSSAPGQDINGDKKTKDVGNGMDLVSSAKSAVGGIRRQEQMQEATIEWTTTGGDIDSGIAYSKNYDPEPVLDQRPSDSIFPFWGYFKVTKNINPPDGSKIIVTTDYLDPACNETTGAVTVGVVWPTGMESTDSNSPFGEVPCTGP